MAKTPVRFKRVAAAFDEVAKARLCESSGSEHSHHLPESFTDLSNLVNCFIEKDGGVDGKIIGDDDEDEGNDSEPESCCDSKKKDMLEALLIGRECDDDDDDEDDDDKRRICEETEFACGGVVVGDKISSHGFKRRLMSRLRDCGFDAGLCKSRWDKTAKFPAGNYEFVDVNLGAKKRYIIEVNLAAQFEIARPTVAYVSLLSLFPRVLVGKPAALKKILRLMCGSARESIKRAGLSVPPWRRNGYMQAKWFSPPHKWTTDNNAVAKPKKFEERRFAANQSIAGFVTLQVRPCKCRDIIDNMVGLKAGQLTAAFSGNDMVD